MRLRNKRSLILHIDLQFYNFNKKTPYETYNFNNKTSYKTYNFNMKTQSYLHVNVYIYYCNVHVYYHARAVSKRLNALCVSQVRDVVNWSLSIREEAPFVCV